MSYQLSRADITMLCMLAVSGCGEIAFKRGSGPDAFAAARASCREQNADPAAMHACLSQAGWNVADLDTGLDASPPPASTPAAPPAPGGTPAAPPGKISVGSWWKFGAGAADLQAAADACAAGLGPDDRPDAGYHLVTRALYACLRDRGWHGIGRGAS